MQHFENALMSKRSMHKNLQTPGGLTLIELIATMAIAAILLTTAVPSFFAMTQRNRLVSQANDFVSTLSLARAEATSRGQRVVVCKSPGPAYNTCVTAGNWDQGWIVFADDGDNLYTSANDDALGGILRVHEALNGGTTLDGDTNIADNIAFLGTGFAATTQLRSVALCDSSGTASAGRNIIVLPIGQARVDTNAPASCTP